jgi:hypothetical protein
LRDLILLILFYSQEIECSHLIMWQSTIIGLFMRGSEKFLVLCRCIMSGVCCYLEWCQHCGCSLKKESVGEDVEGERAETNPLYR